MKPVQKLLVTILGTGALLTTSNLLPPSIQISGLSSQAALAQVEINSTRAGSCYRRDSWRNGWAGGCGFPAGNGTYKGSFSIFHTGGTGGRVTWTNTRTLQSLTVHIGERRYNLSPEARNPWPGQEVQIRILPHNNLQTTHFELRPN